MCFFKYSFKTKIPHINLKNVNVIPSTMQCKNFKQGWNKLNLSPIRDAWEYVFKEKESKQNTWKQFNEISIKKCVEKYYIHDLMSTQRLYLQ